MDNSKQLPGSEGRRYSWRTVVVCCVAACLMLALMVYVLHELGRPRKGAREASSLNQLRQIGQHLRMYFNDYDRTPGRLQDLMAEPLGIEMDCFIGLGEDDPVPVDGRGFPASYVYVGSLLPGVPPDVIICYSREGLFPGTRTVLRYDGTTALATEEALHDPGGPVGRSLVASYHALVEAFGHEFDDERAAELRAFYEVDRARRPEQ